MSGDVQPKKRKDKKRKKEDTEQSPSQIQTPLLTNNAPTDDTNIHVHKEGGTGGGICAKFIFFILFSALAVLIGLIITEHRGLTDLETVDTESRFSQIFEGWVDQSHDHDDHEIEEPLSAEDDHHEDDEQSAEEHEDEEPNVSEEHDENDEQNPSTENEDELSEEKSNEGQDDDDEEEKAIDESEEREIEDEDQTHSSEEQEEDISEENADDSGEIEENEEDEDEDVTRHLRSAEESSERETRDEDGGLSREKRSGEDQTNNEDNNNSDEKEEATSKISVEEQDEKPVEETSQESSGSATPSQRKDEESDSEKQSDDDYGYENIKITNKDDYRIRKQIDEAQKQAENNSAYAIKLFDNLLQKYPSSPRSLYGKALALDYLADQRRSNQILDQALKLYSQLLKTQDIPDALFEISMERCIKRMRFIGQYKNVIEIHKLAINRFPDNPKYLNDLAVTYLTINRVEQARAVLKQILAKWKDDGFALVHYGFILKTADNELEKAVDYLQTGIESKAKGVTDGRFYFHLGDALARLGRHKEALKVYEEGTRNKVFMSKYQRSLYNVPRLKAKPWWNLNELPYLDIFRLLRNNWERIRDEGLSVMNEKGYFQDESENLRDTGEWKQFELYARGRKNIRNCKKCPHTCSIIDQIPEAKGCKRGQTKFSVMHPGTHVWPHCGPTNCRLRTHLGLKVPPKTFIRVANETRSWKEGELLVFDDSFEHEVWHNGSDFRLILIIDIWHPELTPSEKKNLSPI